MTRLAAAAGMAVALHGMLLLAGGPWLSTGRQAHVRRPRPVTVRLVEPRRAPAPETSPAPEEKARPKGLPSAQVKRPGVALSLPESPATFPGRSAPLRSPVPPRVLSPASTPAGKPRIPADVPKKPAPVSKSPTSASVPAGAPSGPRSGPAEIASIPDATGDARLQAPAPPVKEAVPLYRENPPPAYPRVARRRGAEGTVLLEVLVTEEGRVDALRVAESSGHDLLDKAALRAVEAWRFRPGRRGDRAVAMRVLVPVRFRLQ